MTRAGTRHDLCDLTQAEDLAELRRRLCESLADLGFWGVAELATPARFDRNFKSIDRFKWDNYDSRVGNRREEMLQAVLEVCADRRGTAEQNRRLNYIAEQKRPYLTIPAAPEWHDMHLAVNGAYSDFGMPIIDVLYVPILGKPGGTDRLLGVIEDQSALRNTSEAISLMALYHHMSLIVPKGVSEHLDAPGERPGDFDPGLDHGSDKVISLTPRQREVLSWAAAGKTVEDIAIITGLTARTVRFHFEEARKRYGYATRQQTIVRAAIDYGFDPLG